MKLCLKMTGCKNNRYELDQIILWAAKNNIEITTNETEADYCVINTCTVTHVADRKSRQLVRKTKHANRETKTIVFGCAARMQKEAFQKVKEVDHLVADVPGVLEVLKNELGGKKPNSEENLAPCMAQIDHPGLFRSRALVQIQDGCDNYCSYCIIAAARGKSKNRPADEIIADIQDFADHDFHEVVLTGINIGAYGASSTIKPEETQMAELLQRIIDETQMDRIRLSSMGPEFFNDELFEVLKNPRICRHIHLSIQSGCNNVLEKMRRPYTVEHMDAVIERLKAEIPGMAITTDIIVAFPEESEKDFEETMDFVRRHQLAKVHAFPYSIRQNTLAAKRPQLPFSTKKKRAKALQDLADIYRETFIRNELGKKAGVIWEKEVEPGVFEGVTDHYIRVQKKGNYNIRSLTEEYLDEKNVIFS